MKNILLFNVLLLLLCNVGSAFSEDLSKEMQGVLGLNNDGSFKSRTKALATINRDFAGEELVAIKEFLKVHEAPHNLYESEWYMLVNGIIQRLVDQPHPFSETASLLIDLYQDAEQDSVIRAYAIQAVSLWYSKEQNPEQKSRILQTLWESLKEEDANVVSTSIIALHRLNSGNPEEQKALSEICVKYAKEFPAETVKVACIQVGTQLGNKELLPVAVENVEQKNCTFPIRVASIAAIGALGETEDLVFLEKIYTAGDSKLAPAVKSAIARIKNNHN